MKESSDTSKGTALIIEDTEDNMVLICALLNQGGYQTIQAETGQGGFEMAIQRKPDLIILDIQLPDMNGIEVLKMIRASEANGSIPVIAMTSYAMSGDREKLLAAGCTGYIEKPIDPMRVLDQIGRILEKN